MCVNELHTTKQTTKLTKPKLTVIQPAILTSKRYGSSTQSEPCLLEERRRVHLWMAVGEPWRLEPVTLADGGGAGGPVPAARLGFPLPVAARLPSGLSQTEGAGCQPRRVDRVRREGDGDDDQGKQIVARHSGPGSKYNNLA